MTSRDDRLPKQTEKAKEAEVAKAAPRIRFVNREGNPPPGDQGSSNRATRGAGSRCEGDETYREAARERGLGAAASGVGDEAEEGVVEGWGRRFRWPGKGGAGRVWAVVRGNIGCNDSYYFLGKPLFDAPSFASPDDA
jgi:hypothetical protein